VTDQSIRKVLDQPPPKGFACWNGSLIGQTLGDVDVQIRWNEIADFFVYFPDGALQERFVPFAVAAEQRHLSRVQDSGNIIALLKQEPAAGVDQNGASDFAMS
jgi:hypothetical protein